MDSKVPMDALASTQRLPWLLHAIPVNALNFCPFAMCYDGMPEYASSCGLLKDTDAPEPILLSVPNAIDSGGVRFKASKDHIHWLIYRRLTYFNYHREDERLQSMQIGTLLPVRSAFR